MSVNGCCAGRDPYNLPVFDPQVIDHAARVPRHWVLQGISLRMHTGPVVRTVHGNATSSLKSGRVKTRVYARNVMSILVLLDSTGQSVVSVRHVRHRLPMQYSPDRVSHGVTGTLVQ